MTATAALVVDTNVFVHASNPNEEKYFASAVEFLGALVKTTLCLAVDANFRLDAKNGSLVGSEYVKWIVRQPPGSLGREILFQLAANARLIETALTVSPSVHKQILAFIKGAKPRDRTFLKLAYQTSRQELVTHDFEDFSKAKRRNIKSNLGVVVCTSAEWSE